MAKTKKQKNEQTGYNKIFIAVGVVAILMVTVFVAGKGLKKLATNIAGNPGQAEESHMVTTNEPAEKDSEPVKEETLPAIFPQGFPVYSGSVLTSAWSSSENNTQGFSVVWEVDDSPTKVFNFYKNNLNSKGWKGDIVSTANGSYTISVDKQITGPDNTCQTESCEAAGFMGITTGENGKTNVSLTMGIRSM